VESVEKLSPFVVDNPGYPHSVVENVEKLSTDNVEKWKREKNEKNHRVIHIYCG
jgi:hypothetical protein